LIYTAIVIDNIDFPLTGKIGIHISDFHGSSMVWDLADKPEETKRARDKDGKLICPTAMVMTAFGGGHNYGELKVPQINEKGLVSSIRGSITDFVWLGSFFSEATKDGEIVGINFPSTLEKDEGVDSDGKSKYFSFDESSKLNYVLRTRNTTMPTGNGTTKEDKKAVNWYENQTTNIIEIGANNYSIKHFGPSKDGNTPAFLMDKDKNLYFETTSLSSIVMDADNILTISSETKVNGKKATKENEYVGATDSFRDKASLVLDSKTGTKEAFTTYKEDKKVSDSFFSITAKNTTMYTSFYKDGKISREHTFKQYDLGSSLLLSDTTNKITADITTAIDGNESSWEKDKVSATVSQKADGITITYVNDKTFKITLTTDGVTIDAGEKDVTITGKNIKLAADKVEKKGEYFVILSHMKSILDALTNHNHITSTGPTSPGVLTSSMAPIAAAIMSDLQKLGSDS